jgi:hypothetical protein
MTEPKVVMVQYHLHQHIGQTKCIQRQKCNRQTKELQEASLILSLMKAVSHTHHICNLHAASTTIATQASHLEHNCYGYTTYIPYIIYSVLLTQILYYRVSITLPIFSLMLSYHH